MDEKQTLQVLGWSIGGIIGFDVRFERLRARDAVTRSIPFLSLNVRNYGRLLSLICVFETSDGGLKRHLFSITL